MFDSFIFILNYMCEYPFLKCSDRSLRGVLDFFLPSLFISLKFFKQKMCTYEVKCESKISVFLLYIFALFIDFLKLLFLIVKCFFLLNL